MEKVGAVLVIGAGVGGIRAALDLAESGFKVYLVDRGSGIGGTVAQLDKWFPDDGCELCKLLPVFNRDDCSQYCLRRGLTHPNIEFISDTEIEELSGEPGNFRVRVKKRSRWIKGERCTGCGVCVEVCPVEVPDDFNEGLGTRKAVYVRNPQVLPSVYMIDREHCTRCGRCVEVCPTSAIDLDLTDESREIEVGAVIVATGLEEYDAAGMGQYGFGRYANVVNNTQLERMLASAGPTGGELLRPSDGEIPQKIAFLQCVGSRDMKRNYCSSACCMYALKEAVLVKEQNPESEVTIYYMDIRAFGKGYHRYYIKARELGVEFVRCRVSTLRENPATRNLLLVARAEDGSSISREVDLVVLSVGQCPSVYITELSRVLELSVNQWGFIESPGFSPVRTSREGIYVCGSAAEPADIAGTIIQASAAADEASVLLASVRNQLVGREVVVGEVEADDEEVRIAVYICQCGQEIASAVDMDRVAEFTRSLPGVVSVEVIPYLCLPETLAEVEQSVVRCGANRVIMAACAPYHYQRLFGDVMREAGIEASLWQLVNFREQIAWVHQGSVPLATDKARSVLAMAVEKLKTQESMPVASTAVSQQALVIGGGISGLVSALSLAGQGFEVHLVEKSAELGGHAAGLYYTLDIGDTQAYLNSINEEVKDNPRIRVYLESEVVEITGRTGSYRTTVRTGGETAIIEHGVVIVATGAADYQPTEYSYGQDGRIITQKELQKRLAVGEPGNPSVVVMIQCVGSRNAERPYCSRTCCGEAIANALRIKEISPETEVYIFNRDIMTYGFAEVYCTQAREAGVLFIRYELGEEPEVTIQDRALLVKVNDPSLPGGLEIEADLLVLSAGITAGENEALAGLLSLELTEDGFFREMDTKFRPVDTVIDGIFICGLANCPGTLREEIIQARAAARRAANLLSRERLASGMIVSEVNERRCSGCGLCVTTCPYKARWIDEERKVAVVEEPLCQGCGACVALCPNGAAKLRGLKDGQVFSIIDMAL